VTKTDDRRHKTEEKYEGGERERERERVSNHTHFLTGTKVGSKAHTP